MIVRGRMSVFGGPSDQGVAADEGLALIEPGDLREAWFASLFLPAQPPGTTGLARRLDPAGLYLAMRWDYRATPRAWLRAIRVEVRARGRSAWARPVDWGPSKATGRIADLSPGLAEALGLGTDDACEIDVPDRGESFPRRF